MKELMEIPRWLLTAALISMLVLWGCGLVAELIDMPEPRPCQWVRVERADGSVLTECVETARRGKHDD